MPDNIKDLHNIFISKALIIMETRSNSPVNMKNQITNGSSGISLSFWKERKEIYIS